MFIGDETNLSSRAPQQGKPQALSCLSSWQRSQLSQSPRLRLGSISPSPLLAEPHQSKISSTRCCCRSQIGGRICFPASFARFPVPDQFLLRRRCDSPLSGNPSPSFYILMSLMSSTLLKITFAFKLLSERARIVTQVEFVSP